MDEAQECSVEPKKRRTESIFTHSPRVPPSPSPSRCMGQQHVLTRMQERFFDSEWQRGCAMCCPRSKTEENMEESGAGVAVASTQPQAHGCCGLWRAQERPSVSIRLRDPWAALSQQPMATQFDASSKEGVPLYGSSSPSSQPADGDGVVVVRTDLWDSYWAHFSLHAGPRIDALSARLASECTSRGAGVLTRPSRRRVLLKMGCGPAPSSAGTALTPTASACAPPDTVVTSQAAWQRVILFHARHFGAVEFVQTARGIHHVQFTTEQAAQYFHQWISQQRRPQLVEAVSGAGLDGDLGIASDERPVTAVLAPADERRVTPVVLLGPSIRLSTAHAQSLLTGMMGAHETRYRAGVSAFVATFNTALEAKTAVHALQFSLWNMFGVSLLMI